MKKKRLICAKTFNPKLRNVFNWNLIFWKKMIVLYIVFFSSVYLAAQNITYDYKLNNKNNVCAFCKRNYVTSEIGSVSNIKFDKNIGLLTEIRDAIQYTISLDLWNVQAGWTIAVEEECPSLDNRTNKHQWREEVSQKNLLGVTTIQKGNECKSSLERKYKGNYGFIYKGYIEIILNRVLDKIEQNEPFKTLKDEKERQKKSEADDIITKGEVKIGNQTWKVKNLDVDKFSNGDPIPEAKTDEEWKKAVENKQPAWCYYKNDPANGEKYGKLYNWYAVDDPRGIAPLGWHVPTGEEWQDLHFFLKGSSGDDKDGITGGKLKSTSDWKQNLYVNNSTNFSALPGGARASDGYFSSQGYHGYWWCSTEKDAEIALSQHIAYYPNDLEKKELNKAYGISVRCLKGEESQKKKEERQKKEAEIRAKLEAKAEAEANLNALKVKPLSEEEKILVGEWVYEGSQKDERALFELSVYAVFSDIDRNVKFKVTYDRFNVNVNNIYGAKVITKDQKTNTQTNEINGIYEISNDNLKIIVVNNKMLNSNFDSASSKEISIVLSELISMKIDKLKSSKIKLTSEKYKISFSGNKSK